MELVIKTSVKDNKVIVVTEEEANGAGNLIQLFASINEDIKNERAVVVATDYNRHSIANGYVNQVYLIRDTEEEK